MDKWKHGLIVGKFMPLHHGHEYLIKTALEQCKNVTVFVVDNPSYPIDAYTRREWIYETMGPAIDCFIISDINDDDNSIAWAKHTRHRLQGLIRDAYPPPIDVVFTSEEYGKPWSEALGVAHVCVDIERKLYPISGTLLRENFWEHAEMVSPTVRRSFVKKVVIAGAESTGKSTLTKALAERLGTAYCIEYGRPYWEGRQHSPYVWTHDELGHIFDMQMEMEDALSRLARKYLICDTDWMATYVWERDHLGITTDGFREMGKEHFPASLYIVCKPDIPFEYDGTRDGNEEVRERMHNDTLRILREDDLPYILVGGSLEERLAQCENVLAQWGV